MLNHFTMNAAGPGLRESMFAWILLDPSCWTIGFVEHVGRIKSLSSRVARKGRPGLGTTDLFRGSLLAVLEAT